MAPVAAVRVLGVVAALAVGGLFAYYVLALHETRLWFTNIQPVEREISFRTEAGLYYSYYKQLVTRPKGVSFLDEAARLLQDPATEAPGKINLLRRFNIYQEIFLALFYELAHPSLDYILFYTYSNFLLSGAAVTATFLLSWRLSGHPAFGLLSAAWTFANVHDATRVFFTVNMRENFALPFLWLQNALIVHVLDSDGSSKSSFSLPSAVGILTTTFAFSLTWQFNQFLLFLEGVALLATGLAYPSKGPVIQRVLLLQIVAFAEVIVVQFGQPMLIGSFFLSFAAMSVVVLHFWPADEGKRLLGQGLVRGGAVFALSALVNGLIKAALATEDDTHIWTFVRAKLGLIPADENLPFETALYICHGAFAFIDPGFVSRTSRFGMLYCFAATCAIVGFYIGRRLVALRPRAEDTKTGTPVTRLPPNTFDAPALAFIFAEALLFGVMAVLTQRMKFVFFPLLVVLGAHVFLVGDSRFGRYPKFAVIIALTWFIATQQYETYKKEISNEQQFYDPDTVELMQWISAKTPPGAVFAGSMQLMAGVKACTDAFIANHPHFEDAGLRRRTERIYAVYGLYSFEHVHAMACNESIEYLILEDSICLAPPLDGGCATTQIVDKAQRASLAPAATAAAPPSSERFCRAVVHQQQQLFQRVFENRTFRVYRVATDRCKN